jgi:rod shape-determining protein MreD
MFHVNQPYTRRESRAAPPRRLCAISYVSPLLAVIVGIVHASLAPVIMIGGVHPNIVLVAVVLVTCTSGLMQGITWAFVAGLTANLLVGEPLGAVPLGMLIVAALVAGGARVFGRLVWIYPIVAAFAASIVADLLTLGVAALVGEATLGGIPTELILAAAVLNAALTALLLVPARLISRRWPPEEAPAW